MKVVGSEAIADCAERTMAKASRKWRLSKELSWSGLTWLSTGRPPHLGRLVPQPDVEMNLEGVRQVDALLLLMILPATYRSPVRGG